MASLSVSNPYSLLPFDEVPLLDPQGLLAALSLAVQAQQRWAAVGLEERQAVVRRVAELAVAQERREALARMLALSMGKPLAQGRSEVDVLAHRARGLADLAPSVLGPELLPDRGSLKRKVARLPLLGVVVDIVPWNYPLLTAINCVAAAVLAGDAVLLKPSPQTPRTGEALAALFEEAGAPRGLVQSVLATHGELASLLRDDRVAHVAFTGSVRGGKEVLATLRDRLVGVTLELGGKDAAYVAADCDLDQASAGVAEGALFNAGQSCSSVERVYVHAPLLEGLVERLRARFERVKQGDPLAPETTMGPMALAGAPALLEQRVADAVARGGKLVCGGHAVAREGQGRFFEPTLVVGPPQDCALMQEESFGPVLGVVPVDSEDEAVARINDSKYGLTCSLWTPDVAVADRLAPRLQTGTVFMNRCNAPDPLLPWSGCRDSGLGASLGRAGLLALSRPQAHIFSTSNTPARRSGA